MAWPKYDAELESKIVEEIPCYARVFAPESTGIYQRPNTPITPYENMKRLFEGKLPCWLPGDGEMTRFSPRMMFENEVRAFVMDSEPKSTLHFGGKDYFGIEWTYEPNAHGSMVISGNPTVTDIDHWEDVIHFPDITQWDWAGCAQRNKPYLENRSRMMTMTIYTGFFERLISFMDFENAAMALVDPDQQEGVHRLFDRLADFYDQMIGLMHQHFKPDVICIHDDWGSQNSSFFSLSTCREMLVPYLKRVAQSCHKRGIYLNLHSCGKNDTLVPAMVEAEIDMWYPQPMNDMEKVFRDGYGKFVIGVPAPSLAPDAPEEEIRAALAARLEQFKDRPVYATSTGIVFVNNPAITRYQSLMYGESRKFYENLE